MTRWPAQIFIGIFTIGQVYALLWKPTVRYVRVTEMLIVILGLYALWGLR